MISEKPRSDAGVTDVGSDDQELYQPDGTGLDEQKYLQYLTKLLDARRYVDEFFFNKFGFPAYPCLDILLIGAGADGRVSIETIVGNLSLAPSTAERHLDLMRNCNLVASAGNGYQLTAAANELLFEFIDNKLSASFKIAD
ncbi:MAG: hypothetical protein AAGM33_06625 [Pseudomonadota bacterium]